MSPRRAVVDVVGVQGYDFPVPPDRRVAGQRGGAVAGHVHQGGPSEPRQCHPASSPFIHPESPAATANLDAPADRVQLLHRYRRLPADGLQPGILRQAHGLTVGVSDGE